MSPSGGRGLVVLRFQELTGKLPKEYPLSSGERPPQVRRRVGTSFKLDDLFPYNEVCARPAPLYLGTAFTNMNIKHTGLCNVSIFCQHFLCKKKRADHCGLFRINATRCSDSANICLCARPTAEVTYSCLLKRRNTAILHPQRIGKRIINKIK